MTKSYKAEATRLRRQAAKYEAAGKTASANVAIAHAELCEAIYKVRVAEGVER